MSEVESAYIAGMIDGDGCLSIGRQTNTSDSYRIVIKIVQKDRQTLDWIHEHTGVGHINVQKSYSAHQHGAIYWQYQITSHKDVVGLLERIYPYTVTKKRRCELVYHLGSNMQHHGGSTLTDDQRKWRKSIYDEFKSLQSHQPIANGGEFGGTPERTIPSQADLTKVPDNAEKGADWV